MTLSRHGIPLNLQRFAEVCAVAGLRVIELANYVRRVSAPREQHVVLVNCFGSDQPIYKLGESPKSKWIPLTGGMAEIVLLALGAPNNDTKLSTRPAGARVERQLRTGQSLG